MELDGVTAQDDMTKARLFADFFKNQYVQSETIDLNAILNECGDNSFDIQIEENDVRIALESLDVNKGEGPDGFSPKVLRNCANSLTKPLTVLFQKSLVEGCVPSILKSSRIVPIFKSGKKSSVSNYRAVVIIPLIAKIFEMVVFEKIREFVQRKITMSQHGFVRGRSTATNLLEMVNYTMDAMVARCQTDVLYTDFKKAFDRVNHGRLLWKLAVFGFGKQLVIWFYAYLTSRNQFVQIGIYKSELFAVASGVPAGSILGPCLFNIFMNDIVDFIANAFVLLFADDLKLMRQISSPIDARIFQRAVDQLHEWCELNSLHLNIKKCFVMTFAKTDNIWCFDYTFNYGQHTFERIKLHRDLGVIFDSKLNFVNHIDAIVAGAQGALGFIKRTLKYKFSIESAKLLYFALVRPKTEYCDVVWNPRHAIHSDRIESIQKNFVIWALKDIYQRDENYVLPPYNMRCEDLNIHPLWRRRINSSIFFIYDILMRKIESNSLRDRINYTRLQYNANQRTLRYEELIRISTNTTDYAHNQPFNMACRNSNRASEQFFESASRNIFRQNVNRMNLNFITQ